MTINTNVIKYYRNFDRMCKRHKRGCYLICVYVCVCRFTWIFASRRKRMMLAFVVVVVN